MAEIKELKEDLESVRIKLTKPTLAFIAIVFGILVLVLPKFGQLLIASFLIIQGTIGVIDYYKSKKRK